MTGEVARSGSGAAGRSVLAAVRRRALAARIPLAGTVELTARCNLRCIHCYQGDARCREPVGGEMSKEEICALVDESVDAGCLDVLLTGGEPFLRRDFPEIYRHVRRRGVFVTVFTNGTLVTEEHVAVFRDLPPTLVEISLYGATAGTYEAVTGVPGSFERCVAGVRRLRDGGARIGLKTIVLRTNQHEVEAMEAWARSEGVGFRMDPVICPTLEGDAAPLAERVDPDAAARLQFADPVKRARFAEYVTAAGRVPKSSARYQCDAGVVSYYLTAGGRLRPCMMTTNLEEDAVAKGFGGSWAALTRSIGDPGWVLGDRCKACLDLPLCGYCPPLLRLEKGRADASSDYLCATARARRAQIANDGNPMLVDGGVRHGN